MFLNRANLVLAGLLLVVALAIAAMKVDYTQPNIEILPDMKYTPAWLAYRENPAFANGQTLQSPVFGTIARGHLPLHFQATKEDATRAGDELLNPYDAAANDGTESDQKTSQVLKSNVRGGEKFRVFCVSCHGATGVGDGPVAKRGFPPPPSLLTGNSLQMKDGQLFHILTYGQGSMPGFAGQLSHDERWDIVNYVRSIQPIDPGTDAADEPVEDPADEATPE